MGLFEMAAIRFCGSKYHDVDMICDRLGRDLEEALAFQKNFTNVVIEALEVRFVDNNLIGCFKIFSLANMPAKQVGLKSWSVTELQSIVDHYGTNRVIGSKTFPTMVDVAAVKQEFLTFKIHATTEWQEKPFCELCTMVSWNPTLQLKYSNLLAFANIARVQCVSTAQCERACSVQNCIKTKFCNRLQTKSLDSVIRLALEGPAGDATHVLMEAATLWKNSSKFRFLFSNPQKYLVGVLDIDVQMNVL